MGRWLLLVALGVVAALGLGLAAVVSSPRQARADFPAAQFSSVIQMDCLPDGTVRVGLSWTTNNLGPQWVDLSVFNNDFAPGTFLGNGPLSAGQSSLVWDGLLPATWHFVRVNTATPFGWFPSQTMAFFTLDSCPGAANLPASILTPIPAPSACATTILNAVITGATAGCVWTTKGDNASYALGETVVYCYAVSQPMSVRIVVTRPDGTTVSVVDRFDSGSGACIGPYQAANPLGWRTVDMYGGPANQLLWETHFLVQ